MCVCVTEKEREREREREMRDVLTSDGDHGADDRGDDVRVATAVAAADVERRRLEGDQKHNQADSEQTLDHVVPHCNARTHRRTRTT